MSRLGVGCGIGVQQSQVLWLPSVLVNGDFEGAAGPAGWAGYLSTISRAAGTRTGGTGSFVMNLAFDGTNADGYAYEAIPILVPGKLYSVDGWARSVDGVSVPTMRTSLGSVLWTGTNSTAWQHFGIIMAASADQTIYPGGSNLAGGRAVQFDDLRAMPHV